MQKENNKKIGLVVVGILVLVGVFYGGMVYGKSKTPMRGQGAQAFGTGNSFSTAGGARGTRNTGGLGGFTSGEIISKDDKSITVKLMDGGSKIVFFTDKTAVTKNTSGAISDLVLNEQVVVNGSANSDGSVNAQTIQLGTSQRFQQTQNQPTSN